MAEVSCPACGAGVNFRSKATVYLVCEYCRSLIVRHDLDLEARGKVAELQDEMTPLQLGTSGTYKGKAFTLVGRIQREWDGGFWSEWHALFADGSSGWLAQAEGDYMIMREKPAPQGFPSSADLRKAGPGYEVTLSGRHFEVTDVKQSKISSYAGELPRGAVRSPNILSLDLTDTDAGFATIEIDDEGATAIYVGESGDFATFRFSNLKAVDGW